MSGVPSIGKGVIHTKKEYGKDYFVPTPYGELSENENDYFVPKPYVEVNESDPTPAAVSCSWGGWGGWASSVTCGTGTSSRSRTCSCSDGSTGSEGRCAGESEQRMSVNTGPCYTCMLSSWSPYSGSSATCGTSTSTRSRSCTCSDGISRPRECGGRSGTETREILGAPCKNAVPVQTTTATPWSTKPYIRRKSTIRHTIQLDWL